MYNINYGDGRGYPPWSKQQTQSPSQQQTTQQPTTQRQVILQKSPEIATDRLWVDVRNEEEATMHHLQGFKASAAKSHVTPPLDLSENRRQVESPLDLSVKTRKRCADTTEYAEQVARLGLLHEGFLPKRLCQTRDYAYPQGHPNFQQENYPDKTYSGESAERNKMNQQRQKAMSKFPSNQLKTQPSPQSLPQTHFPVDIQRQHSSHQARQQVQMPQPQKHSTVQYGLSPKHSQPLHPSLPKGHSHASYEGLSSAVKRNPQTSMTESVALKGFFEPTQKVTVNASSVSQPHGSVPQQTQFPRVPSEPHVAGHVSARNVQSSANEIHEFEESRRHQVAYHGPNPSSYSRRLPPNALGFSGATSDRDVMQSKQIHFERHLQQQQQQQQLQQQHPPKSQREQMVLMSQRSQKPLYSKEAQEQQKLAYMLEMQKHAEARGSVSPAGSGVMYTNRSQFPTYSQSRQPVSATATYQDSLRKEKSDFQSARCSRVTQPVTLSDIQQENALILEHVHAVHIRPEMYGQQSINEMNKYSPRMPDPIHSNSQTMSQSRMQQTVRYEQSRYGVNKESMERNVSYVERNDPSNVGAMNLHPSVIQRPQGYIPPRIVRGSGLSSDSRSQRRSTDISKEQQHISRFEVAQGEHHRSRLELTHRDRAAYQQKSQDMLSGKEVMKIQQRVAEQRGECHATGLTSGRGGYGRSSIGRDHERVGSNSSSSTYKNSGRRKSLPENQLRDMQAREVPHRQTIESSNNEKPIMIPVSEPSSDEARHDIINKPQRQMISTPQCPSERSITKGTSGIVKFSGEMDPFSQFLMRELKKTDDDNSVNPFANRSLLQEFDRSANSSPIRTIPVAQNELTDKSESNIKNDVETGKHIPTPTAIHENPSYTLPLQIAIPGHKHSTQSASSVPSSMTSSLSSIMSVPSPFSLSSTIQSQTTSTSARSSVITGSSKVESSTKNPKLMSRKHMILSAFRMEEDLKNTNSVETVNIDQDEKVPMESAKFAARKSERDQSVSYPTSPKMPILSPQERNRSSSLVNPAVGEPPNLEESSTSNSGKDCSKKEINSLEEHLHRLISDAVKGSKNKDKESVYETVRRELISQPQVNKVFLSRQLSQTRNIPVANVAPIVHGKSVSDSIDGSDKSDSNNFKEDFDEEDAKMADIVTRSLFGNQALLLKDTKPEPNNERTELHTQCEHEAEKSDSNLSFASIKEEPIFDENSNSKRMSPGLKKLMLYRHRDGSCNSREEEDTSSRSKEGIEKIEKQISNSSEFGIDNARSKRNNSTSKSRNVFGAFSEIVAQHSSLDKSSSDPCVDNIVKTEEGTAGSRWTGYQSQDHDEHDIHMVFNTDYDGDDEQAKDTQILRWNKPSNTKQHADRLIKKARHRRNSKQEGNIRALHALHRKRKSQKGFVDFMPQVLPRRTRSKTPVSTTKRRKGKTSKFDSSPSRKYSKRSSSQEIKPDTSSQKPRQRRASSLDRETKSKRSKLKSKQSCFSDNELDSDNIAKHGNVAGDNVLASDAVWHNEYESTDEDYFQNYEDEFKQLSHKTENNFKFKKTSTVKKRKGFHFKQTYIFQRKRKSNKSRARGAEQQQQQQQPARAGHGLDGIYSFHEEGTDVGNLRGAYSSLASTDHIPAPADLRRVTVNKDSGQTVLHRAVKMNLEEVVLYCLATGSVEVNARDNAGYTALHECALRGRVQIGKHLLTYGADVNCCSTDGGIRPIHDAVENDHIEIVRLLLSYGADPTLSTYAGRSLMKIARTERMVRFLQRYVSDLNGYATDDEERPWKFKHSSCILAPETGSGCAIYDNLPSDPEDESPDMFSFSSKPVFPTRRLTLEPNKRVEDFLLLEDVLQAYGISTIDLQSQGIHHLIKTFPMKSMLDFHHDSIYLENFLQKTDCNTIEVVRKVDSTQIISKLEKMNSVHTKKTKKTKENP